MSATSLLVIGSGSYLAREFMSRHADLPLRGIAYEEADRAVHYEGATGVVNFAFAPELHDLPYDDALNIDARAARHAAARGLHYVMMSSRRVYQAGTQWNATEDAQVLGLDAYGRNKLRIEGELRALLGERLTVLRPGNVIGYEPLPGRKRFAAWLQNQLLESGRIRLTVNPQLRRDLVPLEFFCRVLREAMLRRVPGTFNVGSGKATSVGDAARWLIEGYGSGELVSGNGGGDEFQLDSAKLARVFGLACGADDVERTMRDAGRRLAAERKARAGGS
jgi:UDP-glucose 4-epimerase